MNLPFFPMRNRTLHGAYFEFRLAGYASIAWEVPCTRTGTLDCAFADSYSDLSRTSDEYALVPGIGASDAPRLGRGVTSKYEDSCGPVLITTWKYLVSLHHVTVRFTSSYGTGRWSGPLEMVWAFSRGSRPWSGMSKELGLGIRICEMHYLVGSKKEVRSRKTNAGSLRPTVADPLSVAQTVPNLHLIGEIIWRTRGREISKRKQKPRKS
jgi:hypothetical protein